MRYWYLRYWYLRYWYLRYWYLRYWYLRYWYLRYWYLRYWYLRYRYLRYWYLRYWYITVHYRVPFISTRYMRTEQLLEICDFRLEIKSSRLFRVRATKPTADGFAVMFVSASPRQVNGKSLKGCTHEQAITILRQTPANVSVPMLVLRDSVALCEDDLYEKLEIELTKKPGRGLGLSIVSGNNDSGIVISDIVGSACRLTCV